MKVAIQINQLRLMSLGPARRILGHGPANQKANYREGHGRPENPQKMHSTGLPERFFGAGYCNRRKSCFNSKQVIALIFIWPALDVIPGAGLIFARAAIPL